MIWFFFWGGSLLKRYQVIFFVIFLAWEDSSWRIAGLLCRTTKISAMEKKCWVLRHLVDKQTFSNQGWWWKDDVPMSCFRGLKSFLGQHGGGSAGLAIISVTYVPLFLSIFDFLAQCAAPDFANLQHQNLFLGPVSRFWAPCRVVFRTFGNQATRYYTFVLGLGSECGLARNLGCEFGMDLQALWVGGTWWLNIGLIGGEIGPVDILDYSLFLFQHVKFGKMDIDSIWFIGGLIQKAVNCHGKMHHQ